MITNFNQHTQPLTAEELGFIPHLIDGFKGYSKNNPIKAKNIIESINSHHKTYGLTKKITEARLRKMVNHIRANGLHPVMSSSNGYYTSYEAKDIKDQVQSMRERAGAINSAASGLEKYIQLHTYQNA